jgi:mannose-6-phosphate isomerase-like protein (cupin superfamily)
MAYKGNIERETLNNTFYRKVLHTTKNMQLVVMSLNPKEEIGMEVHKKTSQFIRVESGTASAVIGKKKYRLKEDDVIIIPPNTKHNVINTGPEDLKLYTIYTPPEHARQLRQRHKPDNSDDSE